MRLLRNEFLQTAHWLDLLGLENDACSVENWNDPAKCSAVKKRYGWRILRSERNQPRVI
jgi:hypothetical protein